jgi:MFS family permease
MFRDPGPAVRRWLDRWRPVLPLMAAELILWLGFGAFLPVLPLYVTERGVDVPTLGIVVAAWPATRLVGEPLFGWLADHTRRVPLMVIGLLASAVFAAAPLAVSGVVPFVILRALAGLAAAMYDPAARGYLMDATPTDRRGEAFGLYGAAQMAGFLLGPALGALAAAVTHSTASVFVLGGVSVAIAGLVVAFGVGEQPRAGRSLTVPPEGVTEFQRDSPGAVARAATAALRDEADTAAAVLRDADPVGAVEREPVARPVNSLVNRLFIAAIVLNFGAFFAGGTWEVIWSLFMQAKGASIEFIGFTFALFSLPVLIVSPLVGRLVDRRGPLPFLVVGSLGAVVTGIAYTLTDDLVVIAGIVVLEALGWALVNPALYAVVAAGSPPGRSSTAQGVFGTSGTLAYIVSSILAGRLLATDLSYPFYALVTVVFVTLVVALLIAGRSRLAATATAEPARLDVAAAPSRG